MKWWDPVLGGLAESVLCSWAALGGLWGGSARGCRAEIVFCAFLEQDSDASRSADRWVFGDKYRGRNEERQVQFDRVTGSLLVLEFVGPGSILATRPVAEVLRAVSSVGFGLGTAYLWGQASGAMNRALRLGLWVWWCVGAGRGTAVDRPTGSLTGTLRWMVIAHRGEHRSHPENTLEAIEGAIRVGADLVEMDVRRTSDGRYVLMHDATVDRMTDGQGRVSEKTWHELSALKVADKTRTHGSPSRIPGLQEALEACRGRIQVYLDFKAGEPADVVRILKQSGMEARVWIYDHPGRAARWRQALPGVRLILSPPAEALRDEEALRQFVSRHRPEVVDQASSREFVGWCRNLGVRVWVDIQRPDERPEYWERFLGLGVDGVQTDHPAGLKDWLGTAPGR